MALLLSLLLTACHSRSGPVARQAAVPPPPSPVAPSRPVATPVEDERGDGRLWGPSGDRLALMRSIDASLRYLSTPRAASTYARKSRQTGVTLGRLRKSLLRFRQILKVSRSREEFEAKVRREFVTWRPKNTSVFHFTAYFEPVYQASLRRTAEYRYPLYRKPAGVPGWSRLTRVQIEGRNGLGGPTGPLKGYELVWLRNRLEAYLAQVQGSVRVRLTDGRTLALGFDGHVSHSYTSLGMELVRDGRIPKEELTLPRVIEYLREHPGLEDEYLPRNRSFVFFRVKPVYKPPTGSLRVTLTPERSIATDKRLVLPGGLALMRARIENPLAVRVLGTRLLTRYVLDQDSGGAIKGPRVDLYMGSGEQAGERAGVVNSPGALDYLLLKQPKPAPKAKKPAPKKRKG